MQRKLTFLRRSEDEEIKDAGLTLDLDEISRKGTMSREEKGIAKWYEIYSSRQAGNHMARVVIPGGVLLSVQIRNLCQSAEKYAQGNLNITTRQAIQFHWLKVAQFADITRDLLEDNLTTFHGCGDVTRNVAACSLAETCEYRRINVRPHALKTAKLLSESRDLDNLPRKFKVTFSGCAAGCAAGCAQPYMNCLGCIAVEKEYGEKGFKLLIGGGMGWKAFVAQEVFSFVPEDKIAVTSRAIAVLFRDHGDRFNRAKSRLKYVVHRYGLEKCRKIILKNLNDAGIDTSGFTAELITEGGVSIPDRPLITQDPVGTDGKVSVRVIVPKGELNFKQLLKLAELSEVYGNQKIYTTNRQNIEIHGVETDKVKALRKDVAELGFPTAGNFTITDIVSCVGTTYCPKAITRTRDLFDIVHKTVSNPAYDSIREKAIVNITGCPNSCSPYRISDLGFRGTRIREEFGSVEGYEMLIGGSEQFHGLKLGEFKMTDCKSVIDTVLQIFMKIREQDESLTQCVQRLGLEPFRNEVYGNE